MSETAAAPTRQHGDEDDADRALILQCQAGNRDAFDRLISKYQRRVYTFAYRLTGNAEDAADVAADVFVRLYTSLGSFRGNSSFVTWLYRVVTNIYLDSRKRKRIRQTQSLDDVIELEESTVQRQYDDDSPTPQEIAEGRERTAALQKAIASLPEYQRVMIVMYHVDGMAYEEIAEALEMPIGTVKSRLNRARLALRRILEPVREQYGL
jgi:RNA polymerase sigma-70 factor (ECF subfamily)